MDSNQTVTSVIAKLEYLRDSPIDELETGLDEVNLKMIDLRDRFIEQSRQDQSNQAVGNYLKQINQALSLIFGLEYPVTGFQRNKIKQTVELLKAVGAAPA